MRNLRTALATIAVSALAACGGSSTGDDAATDTVDPAVDDVQATQASDGTGADACPTGDEPDLAEFETTRLYIEHNATDADTGVHAVFGGEAWAVMCVSYPDGSPMLVADPLGNFDTLAVSDLLFESREPENSEVPIDGIRSWFPEGMYEVATVSYDGTPMIGEAWFTHAIPDEPTLTSPPLTDDAETAEESTVPMDGLVVSWEPVTQSIFGEPIVVAGYEVIVTDDEFEDPHGNSQPIYDVHVGPAVTSLPVPAEFLTPGTIYEVEVLVLEESGNQTIGLGFFTTGS